MLCDIAPDVYKPFVTEDSKGIKQLILECLHAIHGTTIASLLYYQKFVKTLKRNNFVLNPYDPCVANRVVDDKQQTVLWHVDDCKISHVDTGVNDNSVKVSDSC